MDKEKLKKSVSMNLRCVTQSCKGGVPLNRLQNDYKDLIGTAIPFKDIGYNTLEDFLRQVPDFVRLKKNKAGVVVEAVADASTAHIASLISKQKPSKASGKGVSKKPSFLIRKHASHESWRTSQASFNSVGTSKQEHKFSVSHNSNPPLSRAINSELKSSAIKVVAPDRINQVASFPPTAKQNIVGKPEHSKTVPTVPSSQKLPVSKDLRLENIHKQNKVGQSLTEASTAVSGSLELQKVRNEQKKISESNPKPDLTKTEMQLAKRKRRKERLQERKLLKALQDTSELQKENGNSHSALPNNQQAETHTSNFNTENKESLNIDQQELKKLVLVNLRSIIHNYKGGILLNFLQKHYDNCFGTPIPFRALGYGSLPEFIQDIRDVISIKRNGDGNLFVEAVADLSTSHTSSLVSTQKQSRVIEKGPPASKESGFSDWGTLWSSVDTMPGTVPLKQDLKPSTVHPPNFIPPPVKPVRATGINQDNLKKFALPSAFKAQQTKVVSSNKIDIPAMQCSQQLKCFPEVKTSIETANFTSLLLLNFLLYGDSYMDILKRGILAFDGFPFCEGSEEWKQREILLSVLPEDTLRASLNLLCVQCDDDNKQTLLNKLMKFLAAPRNPISDTDNKEKTEELNWNEINTPNVWTTSMPSYAEVLKESSLPLSKDNIYSVKNIAEMNVGCDPIIKPANNSVLGINTKYHQKIDLQKYSNSHRGKVTKTEKRKKSGSTCSLSSGATITSEVYSVKNENGETGPSHLDSGNSKRKMAKSELSLLSETSGIKVDSGKCTVRSVGHTPAYRKLSQRRERKRKKKQLETCTSLSCDLSSK